MTGLPSTRPSLRLRLGLSYLWAFEGEISFKRVLKVGEIKKIIYQKSRIETSFQGSLTTPSCFFISITTSAGQMRHRTLTESQQNSVLIHHSAPQSPLGKDSRSPCHTRAFIRGPWLPRGAGTNCRRRAPAAVHTLDRAWPGSAFHSLFFQGEL